MRDRRKQGTVVWLIIFCALLAWLVIMVDCRKLRAPNRRKQKVVRNKVRLKPQLRQYHSDEYEGLIDPLEDYAAFSEYHDDTDELINSQKFSAQTVGGAIKPYTKPIKYVQPVYIQQKKPRKPTTSVIREVHHIPVSDHHKLASAGSGFVSGIKYILFTMLAIGVFIVAIPLLMLPLKLLIGLKLIIITNVIVFGVIAAKFKQDHSHSWITTVTAAPASSSGPATNSQLSISQPVTTVINTPIQQEQQQQQTPPWSNSYWWPFYNSQCSVCNYKPVNSTKLVRTTTTARNPVTTEDYDTDDTWDLNFKTQKYEYAEEPKKSVIRRKLNA